MPSSPPSPVDVEEQQPAESPGPRWWLPLIGVALIAILVTAAFLTNEELDQPESVPTADGTDSEQPATSGEAPTLQDVAAEATDTPGTDETAPDFSVRTFDGGDFTLSRHLAEDGSPVILNLWASWCLPCRTEMPLFDDFAAAHPEVAVVGVAVQDDSTSAADFAEEIDVAYTLGYDEKEEVETAYRALGLPATFWISGDGIIVKRHFGVVTTESLEADLALFD